MRILSMILSRVIADVEKDIHRKSRLINAGKSPGDILA
jgi:hypothetical protein